MITEMWASKRFKSKLVIQLVAVAAHFGLEVDPEIALLAIAVVEAIYVHSQGNADQGKEAAMTLAAAELEVKSNQLGSEPPQPQPEPKPFTAADRLSAARKKLRG